ncbi:hypothetical protein FRC09_013478 [Ceratobasidium sp. 395]|nr:hypothetical protein FRC09_013478 [Ceratobasidium sp. 395]
MSFSPPNVYDIAFSRWRNAQKQLSQVIQDYVDACAALKTALEIFPIDKCSRLQRAEAFNGLDSQLPVLASYEQNLRETRLLLRTTRNTSDSLIPINSLPVEVLSTMFVLAAQQGTDAICSLTLVCTLWRRITLQTSSCWVRIELPISSDSEEACEGAELWAKRAQSQPLHLIVWGLPLEPHEYAEFGLATNAYDAGDTLTFLMPRMHTLEFTSSGVDMNELVPWVLSYWVRYGCTRMAKKLLLDIPSEDTVNLSARNQSLGLSWPTLDAYKTFFCSLRTLSLKNAKLDWKLGFYSGLVDLHLQGPLGWVARCTQSDIAAILQASPKLQSLSIVEFDITTWGEGVDVIPSTVPLDHLKLLRLKSNKSSKNHWTVLELITSISDSIQMSLTFEDHPKFIPTARSFLKRLKVTELDIDAPYLGSYPAVSPILDYIWHVERLTIRNCLVLDTTWQDSAENPQFWSTLDDLCLINCGLDLTDIQQLLVFPGLRTVRIQESGWDAATREQAEKERSRPSTLRRRRPVQSLYQAALKSLALLNLDILALVPAVPTPAETSLYLVVLSHPTGSEVRLHASAPSGAPEISQKPRDEVAAFLANLHDGSSPESSSSSKPIDDELEYGFEYDFGLRAALDFASLNLDLDLNLHPQYTELSTLSLDKTKNEIAALSALGSTRGKEKVLRVWSLICTLLRWGKKLIRYCQLSEKWSNTKFVEGGYWYVRL